MPTVVTVTQVRARLNNGTVADDPEITEIIDAAEAEYARWVGPVAGKTLRYNGGGSALILPVNASSVTAVSYDGVTVVALADLDFDADTGVLHYRNHGRFTAGSRNVHVTFTVAVPVNHRETIVADVAGYIAATQRGGGSLSPRLPGEGYVEAYDSPGSPLTLFPRIRALAASYPSIA